MGKIGFLSVAVSGHAIGLAVALGRPIGGDVLFANSRSPCRWSPVHKPVPPEQQ